MKKILLVLCILSILVLPLALFGCAKADVSQPQYVYQDVGYEFFNETQLASIEQACKETSQKHHVTMLVFTCKYYSGGTAEYADAEEALDHFGVQVDGDCCVLVVSKASNGQYHFYLDTTGKADSKVKQNEIDEICYSDDGDKIYYATESTNLTAGVIGVVEMFGKAYGGKIAGVSWLAAVVIGLIVGIIVMMVFALGIKRSYSLRRANATYSFQDNTRLDLQQFSDTFQRSTVTFVVINTSSGGGGGGHSSSGGGGGGRGGR